MKTDAELEAIRGSKEFQKLIIESNKNFRLKEKLQKEELRRYNKSLPLGDITEEIRTAKNNMNLCLDEALKMLKN